MTAAEKYYAFLDLAWPTNPILSADLEVCLPADEVEQRWREFCADRVYARLMPTAALTIADGGSARPGFVCEELPSSAWPSAMARTADAALGLERATACHYFVSPDE